MNSLKTVSISMDEQGLWYTHKSKSDGLITWTEIQSVQEKQSASKLLLKSHNGDHLITIIYQLENFNELAGALSEQLKTLYVGTIDPTFTHDIQERLKDLLYIGGLITATFYADINFTPAYFWIPLILALAWLTSSCIGYYKISVEGDNLVAISILRTDRFKLQDITDVYLADDYSLNSRSPKVCIQFNNESGITLGPMGRNIIEINIIFNNLLKTYQK